MGFLVVPTFHVNTISSQIGVLRWLVAHVFALAGWFTGNSIRQSNQGRALSHRRK